MRPGPRDRGLHDARSRSRGPRWLRLAALACVVGVLVGLVPGSGLSRPLFLGGGVALADDLQDAQKELERIQRLIEQKQAEFEQMKSQERTLTRDLARIEQELDNLEGDLQSLQGQLRRTEAKIAQTEAEIADAQARLDVRNRLMMKRIRAMSEVGYVNYLEVLLGSRSFADFLARFELLRQVLTSDVKLFREVKEEKRQLEVKKSYLQEQQAELTQIKAQTSARMAAVEDKQRAKEDLLAKLQSDKKAIAQALDELERTSEQLQQYILQIQLARQQAGGKPVFIWPVKAPISSAFGPRLHPILKVYKNHTGIDLAAPRGTSIKASAAGIVILAGPAGGYGKCVIIDHGGYWSTLYAHMDSISVRLNQSVSQGAEVGRVGSTGYSTGPHLHFEIRYKGEPQDPLKSLPPR